MKIRSPFDISLEVLAVVSALCVVLAVSIIFTADKSFVYRPTPPDPAAAISATETVIRVSFDPPSDDPSLWRDYADSVSYAARVVCDRESYGCTYNGECRWSDTCTERGCMQFKRPTFDHYCPDLDYYSCTDQIDCFARMVEDNPANCARHWPNTCPKNQ